MNRLRHCHEANPRAMPVAGLECAIKACAKSNHATDRQFAKDCLDELRWRMARQDYKPAESARELEAV